MMLAAPATARAATAAKDVGSPVLTVVRGVVGVVGVVGVGGVVGGV